MRFLGNHIIIKYLVNINLLYHSSALAIVHVDILAIFKSCSLVHFFIHW